MTNAEARCNKSLRPRKPEVSLGRTAQDVHLDSHTAPELCCICTSGGVYVPCICTSGGVYVPCICTSGGVYVPCINMHAR